MRQIATTDGAPKPIGPYSQCVIEHGFVFVAGQGPVDPKVGRYVPADVKTETRQTFANLKAILEAAGSSLEKVVKCNVYLKNIDDFNAMNEIYATMFAAPYPARTTIQAGALPGGIQVEIECIAKK